jgi:hypothetical protein
MSSRPPLDLTILGTAADASGNRTYAGDAANPQDRPTGIQFKTSRFNGFTDGSFVLPRRSDFDHPDLRLLNEYVFTGQDGSVAYEGRARDLPRDLGDQGHTVTVTLAGWISHFRDRRFSAVIIDRDIARWTGPSAARATALETASAGHASGEVLNDPSLNGRTLRTGFLGAWAQSQASEAWYDAGPNNQISRIRATWTRNVNVSSGAVANWSWQAVLADDDILTNSSSTGDLQAAGPSTIDHAPAGTWRHALLSLFFSGAGGGDNTNYAVDWTNVRVIGTHGITLSGSSPAEGVTASDFLEWLVSNYCPKLNTAGVVATGHVISNLAFHDRTFPYEAVEVANRPHLNSFGVWDDKTFHFAPAPDMSDFDWQVRADDPGVRLRIQGDSTEHLVSGLEVEFTNTASGVRETLLAADHDELRDDSVDNPYVRAGYPGEDTISISEPCSDDEALEVGRVALAQRNQPRGVGEIDCSHHIRDRAGNWQPVWKVRADHRIAVVSSDNERPRLIGETSYNHDDRSLTIAVDSTLRTPDAILDTLR